MKLARLLATLLAAAAILVWEPWTSPLQIASGTAAAQTIPNMSSWDPTNGLGSINGWIQQSLNPNEPLILPPITPRNFLDNGAGIVQQRGTSAQTCMLSTTSTNALSEMAYGADRWQCDVNIAVGAGQITAGVTSTPTPPPGFQYEQTLVRNSGSLAMPQCATQEINTTKSAQLAGKPVIFSVSVEALAALSADGNGNTADLYIFTGTGTGQGMGESTVRGSAVGFTTTVKGHSATIATTSPVVTDTTSVVAGQPVWFTAATMPTGMTSGQTYYVSSFGLNSGTAFNIATTYAAAIAGTSTNILTPSSAGTSVLLNVPYITPVWTGLAIYGANGAGQGQTSAAQAFGQATQHMPISSTNWTRLSTGPVSLPSNATEVAVALCFWPGTTTAGGTTDGIAFTGAQLEIAQPAQTSPSPYEFKAPAVEWAEAQRYWYEVVDQAAHTVLSPVGIAQTTGACNVVFQFPVPMDAIPVYVAQGTISSSTFKVGYVASAEATFGAAGQPATTQTLNSTQMGALAFTSVTGTPLTAGDGCYLVGQTAQQVGVAFGADF